MSNFLKVSRLDSLIKSKLFLIAITPSEYLEKYCRVNNRRHTLYKRVFDKHKDSEGELTIKVKKTIV
jgi:hypothetical protein